MNHSLTTRVLALMLAVVMVFGAMPMAVFAEDQQESTASTEESTASTEESTASTEESTASTEESTASTEESTASTEESTASTEESTASTEESTASTEESTDASEESTDASEEQEIDAQAEEETTGTSVYNHDYYVVLSDNKYKLAPGAVETEMILNNAAGSDRKVVHFIEVDPRETSIEILPGYYGIDKLDPNNLSDSSNWKTAKMTDMVAYYENVLGYNVVGAMNTALAYDSDAPYDFMVYNGTVLADPANHTGNAETYLAVMKNDDGTVTFELRSRTDALTGNEWQAVSANFGWLVKDGALVTTTVERDSSDASRSMLGIKADGSLVICQVDGRNAPTSTGLSNYEMGELMLGLGCVWAVNGDGGGSSSFVTKREGTSSNVMRSVPSDGSERPTINGIMVVSNAKATGEFDHAVLNTAYEYYAPGAACTVSATGVDAAGSPADIPTDVTWTLSDDQMGTIELGTFTSNGTLGDVTIQMVYGGEIVGEKLIHVVNPDTFGFDAESTVVPYGKTAELIVEATYGVDNWAVGIEGAYTLTLSDETAATLNGSFLTASTDESKTGVTVTATYIVDPTVTDELIVSYGKGSEILFDFEDGDVSDWMGFADAKQWSIDHGVQNTLVGSAPLDGQFSEEVKGNTSLSSVANGGQVKNGNYAMAWNLDNTNAGFAGWTYNVLFNVGEPIVLRDVANGKNATTLGMWLYIPEGAAGLAFQSQLYVKNEDGTYSCKQNHFTFTTANGTVKNLNSCTEADIPESRWVYASIDLTAYDYIALPDPYDTSNSRSPSIIRTYIKPVEPAIHTFYIDDITLDYSSAVEDRVLPTISNVCYATADTAVALSEGAVIDGNTIAFSANVADNAGLNASSGRILVDGVSVGASVSGSVMASGNVTLTSGVHTVTFEIRDRLGNLAKVTRTFTISGESVVTLSGHNDSGAAPEYDSIYYADINVADISAIDTLTATLKLQNANTWEPQGLVVADGFEAAYVHNNITGMLTVTVKRVGASSLTGAQTLVSLPIRVWSWDGVNSVTDKAIAPETQFATGYCPIVTINCEVVYGAVTFVEGANDGYLGAFGGAISVATNLNDNVNPWHYHTAEAVADAEATCSTAGYTGRTYCHVCGSVVSWGTVIPATGHSYEVVNDQLVCECGDTITGNGLVTVGDKIYYLIANKLVTGWQGVGEGWCYANPTTKEVATGEFEVSGLTYTADETGLVIKGAWTTNATGTRYSYGPGYYTRSWHEIDGATYYFGTDSYMYTGIRRIPVNRNNTKEGYLWYDFGEDGKMVYDFADYDGIVVSEVDGMHYVKNGMSYYAGLIYVDTDNDGKEDAYYYARTSGEIVVNRSYGITKTNDLLPAATYTFGEDGKMIDPPVVEEPGEEVKNGVCADETGKLWYYVDGVKTYGGLMLIDGNYYYARTSGEIVVSRSYGITKTNNLLPAANYTFGADGKMLNPPVVEEPDEEPAVKNGICADENGKLWYYVDDVKTYGGLMLIDGNYYYARTSGEIVVNRTYGITKTNNLLPAANYTFGADGKMLNPPVVEEPDEEPAVKNGICADENGKLWYYVDGVKTYGGLMLIDGNYYYARTSGEIVVSRSYGITKTNGLLPVATYTFGADGKMLNPPAAE